MKAFFATLGHDIRYALRLMARAPGFTAIAAITLALGIGANTAVFSLMDAVMFRALPVQDPKQLVVLQWSANKNPKYHMYMNYGDTKSRPRGTTGENPSGYSFSLPFLKEVEKSNIFSGVAAFASGGPLALSGNGPATPVTGQAVNGDFFRTLGVHAAVGRLLESADDQPSATPALVLNYGYWQRAFGGSPSAVGKVVNINSVPFTIVGVAENKFVSLALGNVYDMWLPMAMSPRLSARFGARQEDPTAWWVLMAARLKPGVSVSQQQAAMELLFRNHVLHGDKPLSQETDSPKIALLSAQETLVGASGQYADPLRVLMVAVGIILLIACANVAGLVLSRATTRAREIAVRLALGARRSRLLRQLLTESVIMAVIGGVLGVALAFWGARAMVTMVASNRARPLGFTASLDGRVLAFTAAISLLTGIIFGLLPALRSLRVDLTPALKEGAGGSGNVESRHRWYSLSNALVVLQAALAIVVLMGAGLLVHTLANLKNLNPGFDTRNTLTFGIDPRGAGYKPPQVDNLYRELQQQIGALPGVMGVSYSAMPLLSGSWMRTSVKYLPQGAAKKITIDLDMMPVGLEFFTTLKMPILAGRALNQADMDQSAANAAAQPPMGMAPPGGAARPSPPTVPGPVVVNQLFVQKYFPNINPIGQQFGENDGSDPDDPDKDPGYTIVGVVQDAKYNSLRRDIDPTIYVPLTGQNAAFEVRTAGDPKAIIPLLRNLVAQHNNNMPLTNILTQTEQIDRILDQERLIAKLSSFFGILALLLACVGLYGLLSYEVTRRTREIGIRMALGAQRGDLLRMVVSQGIALAAAGIALGVGAAIGVGHLLTTLLYGVKPEDPITLVGVTLLLMIVAIVAASVPARRATTVDPMVALRCE
ncbi:MAG TPA: ABC transporter permease [Candidatus Angelobacter sp.]|nr:ABC transporter permease [Candidatus Angelobacter sp.]